MVVAPCHVRDAKVMQRALDNSEAVKHFLHYKASAMFCALCTLVENRHIHNLKDRVLDD